MKKEPRTRKDGLCYLASCRKPITTVTKYGDADAFCSSVCCREYFGCPVPPKVPGVMVGSSS